MYIKRTIISAAMAAMAMVPAPAQAATDPYIGEIIMVGYNFCPRGYANTDGQLLAINQNQALFSLFGTMYGGDGRTTFALPDLRGRAPIHVGKGAGLDAVKEGERRSYMAPKSARNEKAAVSLVGVRYCVALRGTYPSRN